ncbi:MAG: archaeal proteasome endopeptidase complex subunit alpha [Candidatus Diapherotrites archaeon]|uniref:Archaeal proteasome endopeptidase complex subunit alpha n=1 Tax=Candidatus Iainarchaeum sp. TaxID=3101447 RepID=A0A8T3YPK7_9ARCH|nr:archaeal proteasome endopeptidase complex subunit alpha [Candidatus Diapherotrites archaeon]
MYPSSSQPANYDRAATMFSPDGRLYQVEYASKIVSQGTMGVACKYADGIIFGADKKIASRLLLPESVEKMFIVDDHIIAVSAGLVGDARRVVGIARQKAQENRMYYEEAVQIENLVKDISNINQVFTQYGGMRPFGVSFIFGGIDNTGKRLFETEPSGALAEYHAIAIGKNKNKAMDLFEKEWKENMSRDGAVRLLLKALEQGLDEKEKLDPKRLQFMYIDSARKFTPVSQDELRAYFAKKE